MDGTSREFLHIQGWSPNSEGFLFLRRKLLTDPGGFAMGNLGDVSLEIQDLKDNRSRVVLSDRRLYGDGVVLADGRYIYSRMVDPARNNYKTDLWEVRMDFASGHAMNEPRRITQWTDVSAQGISASADGKCLVVLKSLHQMDVYVGSLEGKGRLTNAKRLTLDDRDDYPAGWMPDSRTVLFGSKRSGNFDIYKQAIDQRTAEPLVVGPRDECDPTVTPDEAWLFYFLAPTWKRQASSEPVELMRMPLAGGPSELAIRESGLSKIQCRGLAPPAA